LKQGGVAVMAPPPKVRRGTDTFSSWSHPWITSSEWPRRLQAGSSSPEKCP